MKDELPLNKSCSFKLQLQSGEILGRGGVEMLVRCNLRLVQIGKDNRT